MLFSKKVFVAALALVPAALLTTPAAQAADLDPRASITVRIEHRDDKPGRDDPYISYRVVVTGGGTQQEYQVGAIVEMPIKFDHSVQKAGSYNVSVTCVNKCDGPAGHGQLAFVEGVLKVRTNHGKTPNGTQCEFKASRSCSTGVRF